MTQTTTTEAPARFRTTHAELTRALAIVALAVPDRPPLPVLGGAVVQAQGAGAILSAYDYAVSVEVGLSAAPGGTGRSLIDFAELSRVLKAAAAGERKAAAAAMAVSVDDGVLSTPDMAVPLSVLDVTEYPSLPKRAATQATVRGTEFFPQLARVLPATGDDPTLPVLGAVNLHLTGSVLTLGATDHYRAALAEMDAHAWHTGQPAPVKSLVPARVLTAVEKLFRTHTGPVAIGVRTQAEAPPTVTLAIGQTEITMRCVEGEAPAIAPMMPTECHTALRIQRAPLIKAVRKAQAVTEAKGSKPTCAFVTLDEQGGFTVSARLYEDQDRVRGTAVPTVPVEDGGRPFTVIMNTRFLLDALDAFDGPTVTLHLRIPETPGLSVRKPLLFTAADAMTGDGYRHLLMPVITKD